MTLQGRFTVLQNEKLGEGCYRLSARADPIAREAQPGQFLMLRVSENHDPLLRRPFGIHRLNATESGSVDVLYRVVGKGTRELTRLAPGGQIDVLGPLGRGFGRYPDKSEHLLVAGGIGIAPFPPLAQRIRQEAPAARIRLFSGGKTSVDLTGSEDVAHLCDAACLATEDGSRGMRGMVTEPLAKALGDADPGAAMVYACGPPPMLAAVAALARERGFACEVSLESRMACGLGTCLGCVTRTIPTGERTPAPETPSNGGRREFYSRVCLEGPVFDAREIDWEAVDA